MTKAAQIHAMIDITDGLSADLNRLCTQSGVGAMLEMERLPRFRCGEKKRTTLSMPFLTMARILNCCLRPGPRRLKKFKRLDSLQITRIGTVTDTKKMQAIWRDGRIVDIKPGGYDHLWE